MPELETFIRKRTRQRKSHTKSRDGCRNCKLRRVKCDETKPKCNRCTNFGVSCDYESKDSDLQFAGVGSFQVEISQVEIPFPIDGLIDSMMNAPLHLHVDEGSQEPDVCYIDQPHLDLLRKFQRRTVLTIGSRETTQIYRDELIKLACRHSFLLHAVLRITLMHDRYLYDSIDTRPSTAEEFHSYHAVALFHKRLRSPLLEDEKDAMWGTAAMLGACAFANIEATSFEVAWPLNDFDVQGLDWLKMSEGKREVWKLANPLRDGSVWQAPMTIEQSKRQSDSYRSIHPDLHKLFPFVLKLYNLDSPRPEGEKDPYHTAASILERLIPIDCTYSTIMWFLSFLGHMEPEFRQLLEKKDPSALVLLSLWFAKLIPYGVWWLTRRALFECQAICIYLDKCLPLDSELRRLMEFPRIACGLQPASPAQLPTPSASSEDSCRVATSPNYVS